MKRIHYLSALMAAGLLYQETPWLRTPFVPYPVQHFVITWTPIPRAMPSGRRLWWTTWSGAEGGSEDGEVTDLYAYSAPNSMTIEEGGLNDVILKLGKPVKWLLAPWNGKCWYRKVSPATTTSRKVKHRYSLEHRTGLCTG